MKYRHTVIYSSIRGEIVIISVYKIIIHWILWCIMDHTKISGDVKKQPYTLHTCIIYHIFTSKYPINVILKPRRIIRGTYTYAYILILPLYNACIRLNNYSDYYRIYLVVLLYWVIHLQGWSQAIMNSFKFLF